MGTVRFGNDHFAAITGYGDYVQGDIIVCHVYYIEGLGHNLFSVGQFCYNDLEVAFCSKTCYVRNLEGDDLLTEARESNLYTISILDMAASSPVCLISKATSTKSWLWHRRLSHPNFGTINDITKNDLFDGLLKFKYSKDHLCSGCERGKSKKYSHPPKLVPNTHSKLEFLHMDLCGPMRVATINGKKYILVIIDDYSRFTWVYFLHTKDKTPEIIKKFIAQELTVTGPPSLFSTPLSSSSKLSATQRLLSLFKPKTGCFKRYKCFFDELQGRYGYLFEHLKTRFMPRKKFHVLAQHLQEVMEESLPKMVDARVQNQADVAKMIADTIRQDHENLRAKITSQLTMLSLTIFLLRLIHLSRITYNPHLQQDDLPIWLALKYKFERLHVSDTSCRPFVVRPRDQDDPHDDAHPKGENSNQEQLDDFDFWTDSYATDDDELSTEKVSQELVEEISQTVDEAKLRKVVNEMLRQ
ncbi:retrovirus-related pol polyprotein from transposon TNT 1-94 [Tanacetum coccineum]